MSDYIELRSIIDTLLRRWWIVVLGTLLAAAIGYGASRLQSPVYQATTSVMVGRSLQVTDLNRNDIQLSQQLALTYAEIARRQPVLQATIDALGLDISWRQLRGRVGVEPVASTELLEITVEAGSPEEARQIADEIVHNLILLSPAGLQHQETEAERNFARERLDLLRTKIETAQSRIESLETTLLAESSPERVRDLQNEINTLDGMITRWEDNYTKLLGVIRNEQSANFLTLVEPAQAGGTPIRPRVQLNTLVALAIGLVLSLGLVYTLGYLDNSLHAPDELCQTLNVTSLGQIRQIKGRGLKDQLVILQDSFSPASEDYRLLRSKFQFRSADLPGKSLMVTSALGGEGKSLTVANLGIVMAQAGLKTIIVDANLRQPIQHEIFQIPNRGGLTYLLRAPELKPESQLYSTLVPNLYVLSSGELPSNPSELVGSLKMKKLLAELTEIANVVICDTPQALTIADAIGLSTYVDEVVLVVEAGRTPRDTAAQAVGNLRAAGAHIMGAVLNRA